jgi:hypothetical protein
MRVWRQRTPLNVGEGDSMVELGFLMLGIAFSVAVAQVFFVPRRERSL